MIKHFLKIAIRNLGRQKVLSVINVSGLSIGLACFILFMLYAVSEFSYDRFHTNKKDIYRVYLYSHPKGEASANYDPYLPMPIGAALKQDLPDIKTVVRTQQGWAGGMVKANGKISKQGLSFADPELFTVFSFPLKAGNAGSVLKEPASMVLSERKAAELFGSKNPVGEILEVDLDGRYHPFTITGVVEEMPGNSSIRFDMLVNFEYLNNLDFGKESIDNWNMGAYQVYVQLQPGSRLAQQQDKLIAFRKKYYPKEEEKSREAGWKGEGPRHLLKLQPLTDIHTNVDLGGTPAVGPVNPENIWTLIAIAAAVLLIACINFTTLAIGRSVSRAREVGIRKVVGGMRRQLIMQFIAEAILLTTVSIILGLIMANILLPWFNRLAGTELQFSFTRFPELVWLIIALAVVVGITAGSYPALILSGFNPIEVLKQKIKVGGSNLFTRSLVTFQFVLSICLIACTLVMVRQTNYLVDKNPGFNKENVLVVDAYGTDTKKIFPLFKQAVSKLPTVKGIAGSELGLGEFGGWSRTGFNYNGKQKDVWVYPIDYEYLNVTGIQLIAGRNFDPAIASDTINSIIVNEAMVKNFGWTLENAIGQTLPEFAEGRLPVVIGVVKDFHFRPFYERVTPQLFHHFSGRSYNKYFVRIQPGNPSTALDGLQKAWSSVAPGLPFKYSFVDENLARFYDGETRWTTIIAWAGAISIFLASLGLFGLAALAIVNRTKEIGIRKVLGASMSVIIGLMTKDFFKLIIIAIFIATPLAWYFMQQWLQHFAYRISPGWWIFAAAGLVSLVIAFITIGFHAVKASLMNPVKSLRTE
jgi:putative ABC transport system permease protein